MSDFLVIKIILEDIFWVKNTFSHFFGHFFTLDQSQVKCVAENSKVVPPKWPDL